MGLQPTIKNIRGSEGTVKKWAEKRGFKYQTVIKVLNGFAGKRRIGETEKIIKRLKKDGFFEEDSP